MTVSWLTQDAGDVPADLTWLTESERARLAGLRVPSRRRDWVLGRWTAKRALVPRLDAPAARIEIRAAGDGAPEPFLDGAPAPWTLSLSHRAGRALCAVTPGRAAPLGCDLELIEPRDPGLVADFFAAGERALVRAAAPDARTRLVALVWSAKESALKALRAGLREDPRDVVVAVPAAPPSDGAWQPLRVTHAPSARHFDGWWREADRWVLTVIAPAAPPVDPSVPRPA